MLFVHSQLAPVPSVYQPLQLRREHASSTFSGCGPAIVTDIAKPRVRPGQVLIKIGAAGVCHSDLHLMEEDLGFTGQFTLGHENAGWIAELGESVDGFKEGDAVAVYGPWGCGHAREYTAR